MIFFGIPDIKKYYLYKNLLTPKESSSRKLIHISDTLFSSKKKNKFLFSLLQYISTHRYIVTRIKNQIIHHPHLANAALSSIQQGKIFHKFSYFRESFY